MPPRNIRSEAAVGTFCKYAVNSGARIAKVTGGIEQRVQLLWRGRASDARDLCILRQHVTQCPVLSYCLAADSFDHMVHLQTPKICTRRQYHGFTEDQAVREVQIRMHVNNVGLQTFNDAAHVIGRARREVGYLAQRRLLRLPTAECALVLLR